MTKLTQFFLGVLFIGGITLSLKASFFNKPSTVDLYTLGTVELPTSFKLNGLLNVSMDSRLPATVENVLKYHKNSREAIFEFKEGEKRNWGGYALDPVLLNICLFNANLSKDQKLEVKEFSVKRYYSPVPQENIPMNSSLWQKEELGKRLWQWREMKDHFDTNKNRNRWAIILIDEEKGVRLDFFTWQSEYSLASAKRRLSQIADSIKPSSRLASHFKLASTYESRMEEERNKQINNLEAELKSCGISKLVPGQTVFSTECAVWQQITVSLILWPIL